MEAESVRQKLFSHQNQKQDDEQPSSHFLLAVGLVDPIEIVGGLYLSGAPHQLDEVIIFHDG